MLVCLMHTPCFADDAIRFGVPPWPGVTVKTEVATQILEAMGYETVQLEVGPPVIYEGITTDDIDAYVAAWLPAQIDMYTPVLEAGGFEVAAVNLEDALIGIAVPTYVYEAGVTTMADLDAHADKFNHTILSIEVGSGMHTSTEALIANDVVGLGDWTQSSSTTPVMLSVVEDHIEAGDWVVFHAWKPHWMTIQIDMKFLEGVEGTENLVTESTVETLVSSDFNEQYPEAYAFLKNFVVTSEIQSLWIHNYGFEEIAPETVAHNWIAANLDTVEGWLQGVNTVSGEPAIDAVRAAYE
ncbi:MAG: glycine/betaine ABC transporter substrate-binding protein [Desulfovibrio sp.]|nr:MAG: glycine/betaine ABC transporter substrate-binding protein [Desulfovibrio sp.]